MAGTVARQLREKPAVGLLSLLAIGDRTYLLQVLVHAAEVVLWICPVLGDVEKILLSCIPVAVVGLFFKDQVEEFFGNGLTIVGICLMVTAALLAFAYFYPRRRANLTSRGAVKEHDIRWTDAFVIGCAQAAAVLPGLSRSGSTIATGMILGDRRSQLAQFSFFMVIIPILGEALLDVKKIIEQGSLSAGISVMPMLVGFLAAFLVGCLACKWMISLVKKGKLVWFAIYCAIMGIVCIVW